MTSVTSTRASDKTRKEHNRVKKSHMFGPDEIDPYVRASIDKGNEAGQRNGGCQRWWYRL